MHDVFANRTRAARGEPLPYKMGVRENILAYIDVYTVMENKWCKVQFIKIFKTYLCTKINEKQKKMSVQDNSFAELKLRGRALIL